MIDNTFAHENMVVFTQGVNRVYLTFTQDGVVTLGPNVTWDEAADSLLDALERRISVRATAVRRATDVQGPERDGGA
jgi:hypothetical protein